MQKTKEYRITFRTKNKSLKNGIKDSARKFKRSLNAEIETAIEYYLVSQYPTINKKTETA